MMREKLLRAMKEYFGADQKRIAHACRVLSWADKIMGYETADREIVEAAAILHDIGIHAAERKHGSSAGKFQEIEGPPIAENILKKTNFPGDKIEEVLQIIAHHHSPGKVHTQNFKILYDADLLVNLRDERDLSGKDRLAGIIEKAFLTETGKKMAGEAFQ